MHHPVSVIIAARNEAQHLPRLIAALLTQNHPSFEIIIVNDRSTDNSKAILNELSQKHRQLKVLHIDELPAVWTGKKYAIFLAVQAASNEILLFTDADCLPKSNAWIQQMTGGEFSDLRMGYSPYATKRGLLDSLIHFETLMTAWQYFGWALWNRPYMAVGRNMAIRKSIYDLRYLMEIKHLVGGDDDLIVAHLVKKHNIQVNFVEEAQTMSQPEKTWSSYLKQKTRHLSAGKHYHQKEKTVLSIYMLSYVLTWGMLIWLLFQSSTSTHLILAFGIKSVVYYMLMHAVSRQFNNKFRIWALPITDVCYIGYVVIVSIRVLLTRKTEWK